MKTRKRLNGSFATYKDKDGHYHTEVSELAKTLVNWGNFPKFVGDNKAMEISILARAYIAADKCIKKMKRDHAKELKKRTPSDAY